MVVYTIVELAELLRLKPRAARQLLATRQIKGKMVGKRWLCTEEALRRFLEQDGQEMRKSLPRRDGRDISSLFGPLGTTQVCIPQSIRTAVKPRRV